MSFLRAEQTQASDQSAVKPPGGRGRAAGVMGFLILLMALPVLATTGAPRDDDTGATADPTRVVHQVAPEQLQIHAVAGRATPPALLLQVDASEPEWAARTNADWLALERADNGQLAVSVNHAGMEPGIYRTQIHLAPGPVQVPVTLEIHEPVNQATFEISPVEISLTAKATDPPSERNLTIDSDEPGEWSAVSSAPWLRLSTYSGETPDDVTVSIDPSSLPQGVHEGVIWIGKQRVPVTIEITSSSAETTTPTPAPSATPAEQSSEFDLWPSEFSFAAVEGGKTPTGEKIEIDTRDGEERNWTAETDAAWIELSATSGTTPDEVWVGVDFDALRPGQHEAEVTIGDATIVVRANYLEAATPDPAFDVKRDRNDLPVEQNSVARSWLWGQEPIGTLWEPYEEAADGMRRVQYYDKGRLEISDSDMDAGSFWYVTTGLLPLEMIVGEIQIGEDETIEVEPADIPIAGDAENNDGPTYASLQSVLDMPAYETGSLITYTINRDGEIGNDPALADYGVTVTGPNAATGHTIASVFWEYLTSSGLVWENGLLVERKLFDPWDAVFGLPITEPYWANVTVNGAPEMVLVQCFERRCLTYTPAFEPGWQVEIANSGLHYFTWRYEQHFSVGGADALPMTTDRNLLTRFELAHNR